VLRRMTGEQREVLVTIDVGEQNLGFNVSEDLTHTVLGRGGVDRNRDHPGALNRHEADNRRVAAVGTQRDAVAVTKALLDQRLSEAVGLRVQLGKGDGLVVDLDRDTVWPRVRRLTQGERLRTMRRCRSLRPCGLKHPFLL
jgi:hypothetical protein